MELVPTKVTTDAQVEAMRLIFNDCLPFMTKRFQRVTQLEQKAWWQALAGSVKRFKAFTYATRDEPERIAAYSLIRWNHDGQVKPLCGIASWARGRNFARQVIRHYLVEAGEPMEAEERADHAAIVKLNAEAGWLLLREEDGIRYIYHPNRGTP